MRCHSSNRPVSNFLIAFGERVRLARHGLRLDQCSLACDIGITQAALSKIETGQSDVSILRATKIANALGTTLPNLLKGLV
jgi:transcriptional regulator with XRE-family HTH domain